MPKVTPKVSKPSTSSLPFSKQTLVYVAIGGFASTIVTELLRGRKILWLITVIPTSTPGIVAFLAGGVFPLAGELAAKMAGSVFGNNPFAKLTVHVLVPTALAMAMGATLLASIVMSIIGVFAHSMKPGGIKYSFGKTGAKGVKGLKGAKGLKGKDKVKGAGKGFKKVGYKAKDKLKNKF